MAYAGVCRVAVLTRIFSVSRGADIHQLQAIPVSGLWHPDDHLRGDISECSDHGTAGSGRRHEDICLGDRNMVWNLGKERERVYKNNFKMTVSLWKEQRIDHNPYQTA